VKTSRYSHALATMQRATGQEVSEEVRKNGGVFKNTHTTGSGSRRCAVYQSQGSPYALLMKSHDVCKSWRLQESLEAQGGLPAAIGFRLGRVGITSATNLRNHIDHIAICKRLPSSPCVPPMPRLQQADKGFSTLTLKKTGTAIVVID